MDPVRHYGDALASVTVTRAAPGAVVRVAVGGVRGADLVLEDVGRPAAVNRAVAGLGPEVGWVAVADPGVEWGAGALDALRTAALRWPRAGLLGPALTTAAPRGRPGSQHGGFTPAQREQSHHAAAGTGCPSAGALPALRVVVRDRIPVVHAPDGPTGWVSGACVLVRRTAWDSVGGFDSRYPGCGSDPEPADVDLGDRLARAGWLVVGVPSAEAVVHPERAHGIILESRDRALRRYVHDRHRAPARLLAALARR